MFYKIALATTAAQFIFLFQLIICRVKHSYTFKTYFSYFGYYANTILILWCKRLLDKAKM